MTFSFKSLGAVLVALLLTSCKTVLCAHGDEYFLYRGSNITIPNRDSIQVEDTLWFTSTIPYKLKWLTVNADSTEFDFSGASGISTDIHIISLLDTGKYDGAIDSFKIIAVKGQISVHPTLPSGAFVAAYSAEISEYIFSFGLVAKKRGTYSVSILDIYKATKGCTTGSIQVESNDQDQHLHYLKDIYYGGQPVDIFDAQHSYCFKVY